MLDRILRLFPFANDQAAAFDALSVLASAVGQLCKDSSCPIDLVLARADQLHGGVIMDPGNRKRMAHDVEGHFRAAD